MMFKTFFSNIFSSRSKEVEPVQNTETNPIKPGKRTSHKTLRHIPPIAKLGRSEKLDRHFEYPDTKSDNFDTIQISAQATYVIAATHFDPTKITDSEAENLADALFHGNAISARDRWILRQGPQTNARSPRIPEQQRNLLADFQNDMHSIQGSKNVMAADTALRAISILGRVASFREAIS